MAQAGLALSTAPLPGAAAKGRLSLQQVTVLLWIALLLALWSETEELVWLMPLTETI